MSELSKTDLLKVSARLILMQIAWSEGSMQSEGFAYCVEPGLKKIYETRGSFDQALEHYKIPINTHPYLAGVLAGLVLRMEQDGKSKTEIATFIRTTMGPLAALGDPFFKGALAPIAAIISCIAAILFGMLAGIATALLIFNLPHLVVRFRGVFDGYNNFQSVFANIGNWISPQRTLMLKNITAALSGYLLFLISFEYLDFKLIPLVWVLSITGVFCFGIATLLMNRRFLGVYFTSILLCIVIGMEIFFK